MATRYYIFDNQGQGWVSAPNKTGGLTLKEIRDMFVLWAHMDSWAEPEQVRKWKLDEIADMWDITFCKVRYCKDGYEVITGGSFDYVDGYGPDEFYKAVEQAFDLGYEVILNSDRRLIQWIGNRPTPYNK